jgi:uncharacterized protein (DUF58 family)
MRRYLRGRMARWVRKRQGEDALPLTLARRRLYILPTRAGVGFSILLFLMLVAALNYGNSLALFLAFLLVGFALVSMHLCHRNLLGMQLLSAHAEPTFARRGGLLELTFGNPGALPRFQIAAAVGDAPTQAVDLTSQAAGRLQLPVETPNRGLVRLDRLHIVTTHPFGLFRAWTWVHAPLTILVYPQPRGTLPLPAGGTAGSGKQAAAAGADEWRGLRPFRDGDSPRQVDWKAYAREAPLLVKEYSAAVAEQRLLSFAALSSLALEQRLEQLARWIVEAETGGELYGLDLPDLQLPAARGTAHRQRCLTALALFGAGDSQ